MTENEIVGHEFEQTPEYNERQGGLESCSPWGSQRVRYDVAVAAAAKLLQSCPTLLCHGLQHACHSPSAGACSNSSPLSQ